MKVFRGFDEDDLLDLCEPYGLDDAKSAAEDVDGYELVDDQPLRVTVSSRKDSVSAFE